MDSNKSTKGPRTGLETSLTISPPPKPRQDPSTPSDGNTATRPRRVSVGRAAVRQPLYHPPSLTSPSSQTSAANETVTREDIDRWLKQGEEESRHNLFSQVYEWLSREKSKHGHSKKSHKKGARKSGGDHKDDQRGGDGAQLTKTASQSSDSALALDGLEKILLQFASRYDSRPNSTCSSRRSTRRRPHFKGLRRGSASESDYDFEPATPSVDAILDNTKTLSYTGGSAESENGDTSSVGKAKDREAWVVFKSEILRLTHTLQLKGWRKLPMDIAAEIDVERLSGALTNAVYKVIPPQNIPPPRAEDGSYTLVPRRPPPKLLLRIYGPQVDHLIDREKELQILRRLGRKNIGPKVLGTFNNGRFEEYLDARPLTPTELRDPSTMKQIAKRMRELHDGVDLEEEELAGGPKVFYNWDKWVDRCERVIGWLDKEIQSPQNESKAASEPWRRRGYVCGVPWPRFRKAVEDYRKWLVVSSGGVEEIKHQLVFGHNDTQYGNLLRMEPSQQSPLLLPENEHKQLVVIDFEYASANPPGLEFANHFTEWCYNYHDTERPWACNARVYPTPEQQHQFITAYLTHRPGLGGRASPSITPLMRPLSTSTSTMTPLDLNASPDMAPQRQTDIERAHQDSLEAEAQFLMRQTRLWRVLNSAQWVAWGIVQAKVPEVEDDDEAKTPTAATPPVDGNVDEADEFDYLAYAQDRAMFFWADLVSLGFVKKDQLPPLLAEHVEARVIDY
ncbi:kinase-like domain-containing protein [Aspergillus pseudodeflectus]|uniref:Kinase-like domain-containing protein n=1 Tax=Aspergillus pseudodeflectus TaxID=176178 RepID=A0ABR4L0R2_9EURO